MKLLIFFLLGISTLASASEVATLETNQLNKTEISIILTDSSLQTSFEKYFISNICKPRSITTMNAATKEYLVVRQCRAEIIKFLLDNGYKSTDIRTFVK